MFSINIISQHTLPFTFTVVETANWSYQYKIDLLRLINSGVAKKEAHGTHHPPEQQQA